MDEQRKKIKERIEKSDIPDDLKAKELEIINDQSLSTPEAVIKLTEVIAEKFDDNLEKAGITDIPEDEETQKALAELDSETEEAEKDLKKDMEIMDENLDWIEKAEKEIKKIES